MPLAGVMLVQGKILAGVNVWAGIVLIALAGSLGCLFGSMAAYGIGYAGGRPLMLKYGRYVLISQHDADKADAFFQRWGSPTAFFSRLLPVVRTYISLPAGIARMPFVKFCIFTFLGSFPWCLLLAFVGTLVGTRLASLSNSPLATVFHSLDVVILLAVVVLVALYIWRHIRNDRKAREAHAVSAGQQSYPGQSGWERQPSLPPSPSQQPWGQQPVPPQGWGQAQGWGQPPQSQQPGMPLPPQSPQQSQQPVPPQGYMQGWGQPVSPQPQSQGWGQPIPPQPQYPPQPPQGWGQGQPPQPRSTPAQPGKDGWNGRGQ